MGEYNYIGNIYYNSRVGRKEKARYINTTFEVHCIDSYCYEGFHLRVTIQVNKTRHTFIHDVHTCGYCC